MQVTSKSELLTPAERAALKRYVKGFIYVKYAATGLGVSRQVLDRVLQLGRGAPANIGKIRQGIKTTA